MADNILTVQFDQETVKKFSLRFGLNSKEAIKDALSLIRQEWQQEFRRQDVRMQNQWKPLKTWISHRSSRRLAPKFSDKTNAENNSYYARKLRSYRKREDGVFFLRILKRSGIMLDRYIQGIRVNNTDLTVTIPYPRGPRVNTRAKVHQGAPGYKLPFGVLERRPYDLDRFKFIADREIRRSLNQSINKRKFN